MNEISDEQRASMIGEVIMSARRVESKLHTACGNTEVAGIHALTELLGSRLPDDVKRQLHYIASVRNGAAHEESFSLSVEDFKRYTQTVQTVLETLNRLFPEDLSAEKAAPENSLDLAVEKEVFAAIAGKFAVTGYIPLLGNIYLLYLLLYTILRQGLLLILGALYASAAVLGIKGWQSAADRGLLYVAGGALLFAYIVTAVLSFYAPLKKLPKLIGLLPGINILYLVLRYFRDLKWGCFLTAISGLASLAAGVILLIKAHCSYAFAAFICNYIISLSAVFIWGKKHEK